MDLLSILLGSMTQSSSLNAVSKKTGVKSSTVSKLLKIGLPLLMIYLTKNAKSKEGASSLLSALTQHKTDKKAEEQLANADLVDGEKILAHIFGKDKEDILSQIAGQAGVSQKEANSVLSNISPSVLSGLLTATNSASNQKKQGFDLSDGFDLNDVMALMGGSQKKESSGLVGDLLGSLLGGSSKEESSPTDLIGSLLGGASKKESNGTELLSSLLSIMG